MKIGIIGTGTVGSTLGKRWAEAGHEIVLGSRTPTDRRILELVQAIGPKGRAAPIDEAARGSDAVVLATPWHAAEAAIRAAGDLTDSLLIDCTNPLTSDFRTLAVGHTISGAEKVAGWARGARVVKAFNQTGAGNMANPAYPGGRPIMFVCGDDAAGKRIALDLVDDIGFEAADAGPLTAARLLEPLAMLWIDLAIRQGWGTDFAFAVLRRG